MQPECDRVCSVEGSGVRSCKLFGSFLLEEISFFLLNDGRGQLTFAIMDAVVVRRIKFRC